MSVLDTFFGSFAPHHCIGCSNEGALLCVDCLDRLPAVPLRCYHCRALQPGGRTCRACRGRSRLSRVRVGTIYEGAAKELMLQLKFYGARAAIKSMVTRTKELVLEAENTLIVHVPAATSHVRERGYDQSALFARALARELKMRHSPALARLGQSRQIGARRTDRLRQLQGAFIASERLVAGTHIILVDDVLTTGATLEAAATALKAAGARRVDGLVFAQA